ncbi:hypothetical protein J6590_026445 [Homalodisca vitripennis]|nr:hypothetical protein J6590_026445 [Homalodisca vitripennis]
MYVSRHIVSGKKYKALQKSFVLQYNCLIGKNPNYVHQDGMDKTRISMFGTSCHTDGSKIDERTEISVFEHELISLNHWENHHCQAEVRYYLFILYLLQGWISLPIVVNVCEKWVKCQGTLTPPVP